VKEKGVEAETKRNKDLIHLSPLIQMKKDLINIIKNQKEIGVGKEVIVEIKGVNKRAMHMTSLIQILMENKTSTSLNQKAQALKNNLKL
jgi:hypothetical protein